MKKNEFGFLEQFFIECYSYLNDVAVFYKTDYYSYTNDVAINIHNILFICAF